MAYNHTGSSLCTFSLSVISYRTQETSYLHTSVPAVNKIHFIILPLCPLLSQSIKRCGIIYFFYYTLSTLSLPPTTTDNNMKQLHYEYSLLSWKISEYLIGLSTIIHFLPIAYISPILLFPNAIV